MPGSQGRMKLSRPEAKSVKRRMFSNLSRLVTSLVGRALPSLHPVQIPRWKRLRDEMSSRVDYDVGKVAVRLKLGYLRRKRMLDDTRGNARILQGLFKLPLLFPIFSRVSLFLPYVK